MNFNEKSKLIEEFDEVECEWVKYVARLCKTCGAEPGEPHSCNKNKEE